MATWNVPEQRHAKTCPRSQYRRRVQCDCGFDRRSAREANERRKEKR